jgi:hypothetical protein
MTDPINLTQLRAEQVRIMQAEEFAAGADGRPYAPDTWDEHVKAHHDALAPSDLTSARIRVSATSA